VSLFVTPPVAQIKDHRQVLRSFAGVPHEFVREQIMLPAPPLSVRSKAQVRIDEQGPA
jgi:hypothetical protein